MEKYVVDGQGFSVAPEDLEIFLQKVITYLTYYKIMSKDSKKVITVTGLIEPEDMGLTLSHEHLLIDFTLMYHGEKDSKGNPKKIPIKMENLGSILYDPLSFCFFVQALIL